MIVEFGILDLGFFPDVKNVARKLLFLSCFVLMVACNSESAPDCFQNEGKIVRDVVSLPAFTKITVFENVSLVLQQGDEQRVEVETGEFLRGEVTTVVDGDRLLLRDTNDCNFFRDYGITKVYVTAPNITEIRSSTGWPITGVGVLAFRDLSLLSESFINAESETTDGSFDLEVSTENLDVVVNGIAYFKLKGTVQNLNLNIAAGDSRIDAELLAAENVDLNHRGSNDMFINPRQALTGVIRGTGDVISANRPETVDVEILYKGQLIFR